jgi:hypothetical protein
MTERVRELIFWVTITPNTLKEPIESIVQHTAKIRRPAKEISRGIRELIR